MLRLSSATVDLDTLRAHREGQEFSLTAQEADLLRYLADRGTTVSRAELLTQVWGYAPQVRTRAIDATVSRLRTKLEADPSKPESLISVRGKGYRLQVLSQPVLQASDLLGREPERMVIVEALESNQVLQLVGPGGVGKTSLALDALNRSSGHFVDLSSADEVTQVPTAIARTLELPMRDEHTSKTLARIARALSRSSAVLVLDNLEQLQGNALTTLIRELCDAVETPVLLTSRGVIDDGWPSVVVGPLPRDDARELLIRSAKRTSAAWTPGEGLDELAAAVEHIPLGLELLGARLPTFGAKVLLSRLEAFMKTGDGREGRHSSLHQAVQWSWSLLSPLDQRRLAWWSVFQGLWPIEALEQIGPARAGDWGDAAGHPVLQTLFNLEAAGMLTRAHGLRPWVTVRSFALGALEAHQEVDAAFKAHADWYVSHLPESLDALPAADRDRQRDWAMTHRDDLRAAAQRMLTSVPALSAQLAIGLLATERRLVEADTLAVVDLARRAADTSPALDWKIKARLAAIRQSTRSLRTTKQTTLFQEIEDLMQKSVAPILHAQVHHLRGNHHRQNGRLDQAIASFDIARGFAVAAGSTTREAHIDYDQGATWRRMGAIAKARPLLMRAAAASEGSDPYLASLAFMALASIARVEDKLDEAQALGERGVAAARQKGDPYALGGALINHGNVLFTRKDLDAAAAAHKEAIPLLRSSGFRTPLSFALGNLAVVLDCLGHPVEAELRFREALATARAALVPYSAAFWTYRIALLDHRNERFDAALGGYTQAIEEMEEHKAYPQVHAAQAFAAVAHAETHNFPKAKALIDASVPLRKAAPMDVIVQVGCAALVSELETPGTGSAKLAEAGIQRTDFESTPGLHDLAQLWARLVLP